MTPLDIIQEAVTAIREVTSGKATKVLFLTGHGERDIKEFDPRTSISRLVQVLRHLARSIGPDRLGQRYAALQADADGGLDAASQARRRLKGAVLLLLEQVLPEEALSMTSG